LLKLRGFLRIERSRNVIQQPFFPLFDGASHFSASSPKHRRQAPPAYFMPYGPNGRAMFRTPGTEEILPPIPSNSALGRSANIPSFRICASGPPLSVFPAAFGWPFSPRPASPDTTSPVRSSAGYRKPDAPADRRPRRRGSPASDRSYHREAN